nr:CDH1-D; partial [Biomphalaria glabrata]
MPALPRWMGLAIRDGPMRHSQYGGKPITPAARSSSNSPGERETDNPRALATTETFNDPSAGSPTETLLRLLLSPSDRVRASSRPTVPALARQTETNPRPSLNRSIDSSDGRCVQRAGT